MTVPSRFWVAAVAALLLVPTAPMRAADVLPSLPPIPPAEADSAVALGLALRRLPVMGTVLWITAHPDDESNVPLVALHYGEGLRTVVLTATRGEGGQNEIGPELDESLGLLRVGELEAVHRWDGAEQRFARGYDFGYSFSVEESYEKWGRAEILSDFVRAIRAVRPDVIVTLRREAAGGGQHHQAAARLAAEAFRAAADARAYPPDSLGGLAAWQARKIYETDLGTGAVSPQGTARLKTDVPDALLGTTWFALGAFARTFHRTQGAMVVPGTSPVYGYSLVDSEPPVTQPETGLLDGVDLSWRRLLAFAGERERPALEAALPPIEAALREAQAAFDVHAPERTLPPLRAALTMVRRLREEALMAADWDSRARIEILARLSAKETELVEAIASAHGLIFQPIAADGVVVPGQTFTVRAAVSAARADAEVKDVVLHLPPDWTAQRTTTAGADREWAITVPSAAPPTRPFGRLNPRFARYDLEEGERTGAVFPPPDVTASLMFTSGGLLLSLDRPLVSRAAGAAPAQPVAVLPRFSVEVEPERLMIPRTRPAGGTVEVQVRSSAAGPATAVCRLRLPYGWGVQPPAATLRFTKEDESRSVRFRVVPPRLPESHAPCAPIQASVTSGGRRYTEGFEEIRYPHVATRFRPHPAEVCAYTLDARVPPSAQVGYVAGVGDGMPEALAQLGVATTALTSDDLAHGDLSRFTTIVTGVRAYQTRSDLKENTARLFDYVRGGGNLVLQYNRPAEWAADLAPIPVRIGTRRITDEDSPVQFLLPHHPLLNTPNTLGSADFEGWVQDRAVYLLDGTDERFEELLASRDPFPLNPGDQKGLLVSARVGNGRWTYVGLALWRQLQAGVPGAYRILANLVGQPRGSGRSERGNP